MKKFAAAVTAMTVLIPAALIASPAQALTSWIVAQVGEKPNREMYVIDSDFILPTSLMGGGSHMVRASIVYEAPDKPDRVAQLYEVHCDSGMMETQSSQLLWRHKGVEKVPNMPRQAPRSFGESQVFKFGCEWAKFKTPPKGKSRSRSKKPTGTFATQESALAQGFLFAGDTGAILSDYIWANIWTDGVKPEYTYVMTDAEKQELGERIKKTGESLDAFKARTYGRLEEDQRRARRAPTSIHTLETWIKDPVQGLINSWGNPRSTHTEADSRGRYDVLTYHFETLQQGINVHGGVVASNTYTCTIYFHARAGVIFDYYLAGNYCRGFIK